MYVFLANSPPQGLKKWLDTHRPSNDDDDNSGGATPIALTEPPDEDGAAIEELRHKPWLVPGVGTSF